LVNLELVCPTLDFNLEASCKLASRAGFLSQINFGTLKQVIEVASIGRHLTADSIQLLAETVLGDDSFIQLR
jgi:hypothetical protein